MAELVPFSEFTFRNYDGPVGNDAGTPSHAYITCVNHPTALYLSKNPYQRGIHFIRTAEGFAYGTECPCPFADLRVIVDYKESEEA